jgi:hypothetical protein
MFIFLRINKDFICKRNRDGLGWDQKPPDECPLERYLAENKKRQYSMLDKSKLSLLN